MCRNRNNSDETKQQPAAAEVHHQSICQKAAASAFRGGCAGAIAMILQVVLLMWLRTVTNFQYRNGGSIQHAFVTLYNDGGILRFYQGAQYALLQGPLCRFGDTAANEGVKELFGSATTSTNIALVTACASFLAALWRMVLTPVDTLKTTLQVTGSLAQLWDKVSQHGLWVLYDGAWGNWGASLIGHYPWFVVNNKLELLLPQADTSRGKLLRRAFIGFCASLVAACASNGIRVVKTYKQTSEVPITYTEAVQELVDESGILGLFFRGLGMKLLSNALSSIFFSILWKMLMEKFGSKQKKEQTESQETE